MSGDNQCHSQLEEKDVIQGQDVVVLHVRQFRRLLFFASIANGDFSFSLTARLYPASPTIMNICSLFASMERRSRVSRNLWIRST